MSNEKYHEVLLGFGHDFLQYAEQIAIDVKNLRLNHFPQFGIHISKIHIVDHDIEDSDGKFDLLKKNEYVIYIHGEEKVRKSCEPEKYDNIIDALKLSIEENYQKLISTV